MADKNREQYARTDRREYKHRYTFDEARELLPELLYKKSGRLTDFGKYLKGGKRTVTYSDYKVGKNLDDSGYTRTDTDDKFKDQIERLDRAESTWAKGKLEERRLAEQSMASRTPRTLSLADYNKARDAQAMKFTLNGQQRMAPIEYRGRISVGSNLYRQSAALDKIDKEIAGLNETSPAGAKEALEQTRGEVAAQRFSYDVGRRNGDKRNTDLDLAAATAGVDRTRTVELSVGRNSDGKRVVSAIDPNFHKYTAPDKSDYETETSKAAIKGGKVGPKKQKNHTKKPDLSGKVRKRKPRIRK